MKTIAQFVRTTIVGGLLFLAPIVVLIVILAKALDYAKKGLNAVVVHIPAVSELSAGAATALSVALVAFVCFLAGLLAHTVIAQRLVNALESSVLSKIPGLRLSETGERKRAGCGRDRGTPGGPCAHGRGMAARRSNRTAGRRPRLCLRPRRAEPAFRVGLFLSDGHRSTCRHQAGHRAQLPQAMRRGRVRSRRQLASRQCARIKAPTSIRDERRYGFAGAGGPSGGRLFR